ncbi:hypothetical protein [Nocardiopsis xinjiangensis]|nr:hypothetical protein [Nocardiopsis xinjiangensis]
MTIPQSMNAAPRARPLLGREHRLSPGADVPALPPYAFTRP